MSGNEREGLRELFHRARSDEALGQPWEVDTFIDRILSQAQEPVAWMVVSYLDGKLSSTWFAQPRATREEAEEDRREIMERYTDDPFTYTVEPVGASPVASAPALRDPDVWQVLVDGDAEPEAAFSTKEEAEEDAVNVRRALMSAGDREEMPEVTVWPVWIGSPLKGQSSAPEEEREPGWKPDPCGICGGKRVTIRGQYPGCEDRLVCPTCLQERIDIVRKTLDPNTYRAVRVTLTEEQER